MASNGSLDKIASANVAENSETTIEIKLKTLDSQTYTLRVDKQMPVPALKEQIASVTGVLSEQQRLICRGRVLKDDQLLSAYHVEDGHTLHLVVRQPPSSEGLSNHPATDPPSSTSRDHNGQMPSSVIIETVSLPEQGDGVPPEVSRIVAAVLGSFGLPNIGSGNSEGVDISRERGGLRTSAFSTTSDTIRLQPEHHGFMFQSDGSQGAFGLPTAVSLGSMHPPVFSDSLTTLSQYLSNIRRELEATGGDGENNAQADAVHGPDPNQRDSDSTLQLPIGQQRLPTPASLAEVLLSSRQLLINQIAERLSQLARLLENQANVTDPAVRSSTQSSVSRNGFILHKIGAFLLELGRTTMTVQLGQAPSEAVVNAGPAVFINPSGPNPLMVQPLPFQPATSFGAVPVGSVQPGSGLVNSIGTGLLPRRIDIQIRRGSSTATPNVNHEERGETQQPSGQRNTTTGASGENNGNETNSRVSEGSSFAGESGVRVVPIRSMVAAVPAPFSPLPSDPSGNIGLYYPVLGRFQNVASGQVNNGRGSQTSGEHNPAGVETEQQSTPEPAVQRQNVENQTRDGSLPASNSRQGHSTSRSINIILSAGTMQGNQESDRRVPNSVLQLLRSFIPGGEIRVEDDSLRGAAAGLVPENAGASNTPMESESRVSEEGIFLSNLLREIIPFVTQHGGAETNDTPQHQSARDSPVQAETSNAGTSHQRSDTESDQPNSKRQKCPGNGQTLRNCSLLLRP